MTNAKFTPEKEMTPETVIEKILREFDEKFCSQNRKYIITAYSQRPKVIKQFLASAIKNAVKEYDEKVISSYGIDHDAQRESTLGNENSGEERNCMSKWISVTDGLPKKTGIYFAYYQPPTGVPFMSSEYFGESGWGAEFVTDWMPLPNPPKKGLKR